MFTTLASQARVAGMDSFTGFDYASLSFILRVKEVPEELWPYAFEKLETLSSIAMKFWNKKRED